MDTSKIDKHSQWAVLYIGIACVCTAISQSLLDFFSVLSLFTVLWVSYKKKTLKDIFQTLGIEWAFLGFFICSVIGLFLISNRFNWIELKPVSKMIWMVHLYLLIAAFKMWMPRPRDFLNVLLEISLIPSIYSIASKFSGRDFLNPTRPLSGRIIGMVNSATYHSHALAIIFSFCAGLLFMHFNWRKKSAWAYLCCLLLLLLSIYFTYTRGALLAILMAVFSGLMIFNWRKAVLLVVVFLGVSYSVVKLDPVLMGRVSESINSDKFDTNRVGLFRANMEVFQDHPLFGMGYDIYKNSEVYKQYTQKQKVSEELQDSHAHNQYLQMLSSTGFLGFFFFMCFVLFFLWQNIKVLKIAAKGSELYSVALANLIAHVAILSLFLTDQSFEYTKIRFLVLVVWALTMGLKNQCSALKSQG